MRRLRLTLRPRRRGWGCKWKTLIDFHFSLLSNYRIASVKSRLKYSSDIYSCISSSYTCISSSSSLKVQRSAYISHSPWGYKFIGEKSICVVCLWARIQRCNKITWQDFAMHLPTLNYVGCQLSTDIWNNCQETMQFAPRRRQHVLDLKANKAPPNADTQESYAKEIDRDSCFSSKSMSTDSV